MKNARIAIGAWGPSVSFVTLTKDIHLFSQGICMGTIKAGTDMPVAGVAGDDVLVHHHIMRFIVRPDEYEIPVEFEEA